MAIEQDTAGLGQKNDTPVGTNADLPVGIENATTVVPGAPETAVDAGAGIAAVAQATDGRVVEALNNGVTVLGRNFEEVLNPYSYRGRTGETYAKIDDYANYVGRRANPLNQEVVVRSGTLAAELSGLMAIIEHNPLEFEVGEANAGMRVVCEDGVLLVHVAFDNPADGRRYEARCSIGKFPVNDFSKKVIPAFEDGKYFTISGWGPLDRFKAGEKTYDAGREAYLPASDPHVAEKLKFLEPFTIDRIFQLIREQVKGK